MEYNIISGDGHIDLKWLPHDLFVSNAPAHMKDRMPRVVETNRGKKWFAEGVGLTSLPFGNHAEVEPPERGRSPQIDHMYEAGFFDGRPHPSTPELRIMDQEIDGVDADVIYGILAIGTLLKDRKILTKVYQIYNTWLVDFCQANLDRLVGLACLPNDSPELAVAELHRIAKLGLKGADLAVHDLKMPLWHRDWDVLWAAAEDCGIPISFHTNGVPMIGMPTDAKMAEEYKLQYSATVVTLFQLAGAEFLASPIFSEALERHPGFKFVLGECGVSWIPFVLQRMDEESEDQFHALNLPLRPSEYWRRQGYTTFQNEATVADFVHLVGEDNIMWGSDYPHTDGVWPDSRKIIDEQLGSLDESVRRKITRDNAGKLYGLLN